MLKVSIDSIRLRLQKGTTLLETMIALGLIGVIVVGVSQFFSQTFKAQRRARIKTAYQFIAQDIENKLKNPGSIYASVMNDGSGNALCIAPGPSCVVSPLTQCLLGFGNGCTTQLTQHNPAAPNYFALNYAMYTSNDSGLVTSGDANNPIYYNADGVRCTLGSKLCMFKAVTFWYGVCETSAPCTQASEIHVAYQVSQITPNPLPELGNPFPPLPASTHFFMHQVKDILGAWMNNSCYPGAVVIGFSRQGRPLCECRPPYVATGVSGSRGPVCRLILAPELTCSDPNTVFRGLTTDGRANCVSVNDAYDCVSPVATGTIGQAAVCPAGYWTQDDSRTDCTFNCTMPKQDGTWSCGSNEAADTRSAGGYRQINDLVQPAAYTLLMGDGDDHRVSVNQGYKMGLVCSPKTLKCCRPI